MGHQYFERLSGEFIRAFQIELEQPVVDPQHAADPGAKAVFNRVVTLHAARDLQQAVRAAAAVQLPLGTNPQQAALAAVASEAFRGLRSACKFPDEAERIALTLVREAYSRLIPTSPKLTDAFRVASRLFADQITRSETVFRIVRDGPDATETLTRQLASEMAGRAYRRLDEVAKTPRGFGGGDWQSPRARARRRTNNETGGIDVG